ncbi:MAG: TRAP transporter substrate-binding protein [Elusimicrobiota bacterium]|jgi:tripartite ATP-independent transporter DctP family solute receptor|nr:TRAP transporter substrate-binding protein [Elusimicrobiota bacterium]
MKQIKNILPVLCFVICVFFISGCNAGKNSGAKIWNVAVIHKDTHPETLAMVKMGEIFAQLTDGRYRFEVFPNELLGPQRETLEQVQYGIIEMAVIGNPNISSFVDGFLTFEMPFLFNDLEHQKKFFETGFTAPLFKQTEKFNFRIITYFTGGTRNMYSHKPIRGLADLKGMKIRTAESDTYSKMMKALGGAATPMSFGEVFTAIQSKVVDGAENNEPSYNNSKHYEVAPYYSYTKHLIVPDYLIVNAKVYNSLSDADKKAFQEAAKRAEEYERELWTKEETKSMEEAVKGGAKVIKDVDIESLRNAVAPLHAELCKNPYIKKVYDAVRETADK